MRLRLPCLELGTYRRGTAWQGAAGRAKARNMAEQCKARLGKVGRGQARNKANPERYREHNTMTDTDRINFLERTGANVVAGTGDTLLPESFSVCINRVTGWHTKPTLREAIDACERDQRENGKALS